jgi:hypothetical protein
VALDFNGTTSVLQRTTGDVMGGSRLFTMAAWIFRDAVGEASPTIFVAGPDGFGFKVRGKSATLGTLQFTAAGFATDGQFDFPASGSVWHPVAVSYDSNLTTNVPVARVDFAPVTVTTVTTPVGAWTAPTVGWAIGNTANTANTWDGAIAFMQVWNRILTAEEMDAALRAPGCILSGLRLFVPMWNLTRLFDLSGLGFHGTHTACLDRAGPPVRPAWMVDEDHEIGLGPIEPSLFPPWHRPMYIPRGA